MSVAETPVRRPSALDERIEAFIEALQRLVPRDQGATRQDSDDPDDSTRKLDRAGLAALRRSLGRDPGMIVEACRYVDPWLTGLKGRDIEVAFYLVAGLFGWHWEHRRGKNLGGSLSELAAAQRAVRVEPTGLERRFVALLDARRDDLPEHLRHAVGLLRSHGIPLDYVQLLKDIRWWDHPDRFVRRQWARSYWSHAPGADATVGQGTEVPSMPGSTPAAPSD